MGVSLSTGPIGREELQAIMLMIDEGSLQQTPVSSQFHNTVLL